MQNEYSSLYDKSSTYVREMQAVLQCLIREILQCDLSIQSSKQFRHQLHHLYWYSHKVSKAKFTWTAIPLPGHALKRRCNGTYHAIIWLQNLTDSNTTCACMFHKPWLDLYLHHSEASTYMDLL